MADAEYGTIVTATAALQIAEKIEQMIIDGRLKVDDRLPGEEELAGRFGVSRPTVREALKRLAARHLIRTRRGPAGGSFVRGPSPDELAHSFGTAATLMVALGQLSLEEVTTARAEMEAICCRLAATNRSEEHLARLHAEVERQRDEGITDQEFCASDVRFHQIIAEAAGNNLLRLLTNAVVEGLLPVSNMLIFRVRDRLAIVDHHARIVDALKRRDPEMAVAAVDALMRYTRAQYLAAEAERSAFRAAPSA